MERKDGVAHLFLRAGDLSKPVTGVRRLYASYDHGQTFQEVKPTPGKEQWDVDSRATHIRIVNNFVGEFSKRYTKATMTIKNMTRAERRRDRVRESLLKENDSFRRESDELRETIYKRGAALEEKQRTIIDLENKVDRAEVVHKANCEEIDRLRQIIEALKVLVKKGVQVA